MRYTVFDCNFRFKIVYFFSSTSIVTKAICDLLKVDLRNALDVNEEYRCPYKLETPQHPFILILNKKPENWLELLDESKDLYENSSDECVFFSFVVF